MKRVVEAVRPPRVVVPLRDRHVVVDARLGDDERARRLGVYAFGELREDVPARVVADRGDRVQPQPVHPVVVHPLERALDRPLAHARL
jgi:hypothetical protein